MGLGQGLNRVKVSVPENLRFPCGDSLKGCGRPLCTQSDTLEISCVPSAQQCLISFLLALSHCVMGFC